MRSNVVVVMCDLCVRYTNMVDRYVPNVSACLRDKEPLIRKQTLTMLTNLLQVGLRNNRQRPLLYRLWPEDNKLTEN